MYCFKNEELFNLLDKFLIDDDLFVSEVENYPFLMYSQKLKGKTHEEKLKCFVGVIGNGSRTYIVTYLILKHLTRLHLNLKEDFLDECQKEHFVKYLENEGV